MGKILVIVESPAKAKTIGRYLGSEYQIMASVGHIRDLPSATIGVDVNNNFKPRYINMRGKDKIIKELKKRASEAARIMIATDPDREGEAIAWHIATILGVDPNSPCRITFNEITKQAVKAAIEAPRSIDLSLVDAQQARRILDRLVGYELSPLLWQKVKKGLSAGRVQSVATLMLVEREEEIEAFVPEEYWLANAILKTSQAEIIKAEYYGELQSNGKAKKHVLANADEALALKSRSNADFIVHTVNKRNKKRNPNPPFTTSTLQQDAARKLGFTAKRTMMIAQQLYEGIDLPDQGPTAMVTYIRTDSVRSSIEAVNEIRNYIQNQFGDSYLPNSPRIFKTKNAAQDAHEAIRPSHFELTPEQVKSNLTVDQFKLYRLIWERFLASQMAQAEVAATSIDINCDQAIYRTTGEIVVFPGFLAASPDKAASKADVVLPDVQVGEKLTLVEYQDEQKFTQPPARYNEASLIKAMEEAGIGRPSTYAPTLSTIIDRNYSVKDNKTLVPTDLGRLVTGILRDNFNNLINIKFTAAMESNLDEIEAGKTDSLTLLNNFYPAFHEQILSAGKKIQKVEMPVEETGETCPNCNSNLVIKDGRYGKFIACSKFPECKYTKNIKGQVNSHCPKCQNDLEMRRSKRGNIFYICSQNQSGKCDFISWDLPIDNESCSTCNSYMTWHKYRNRLFKRCSNEGCETRKRKTKETVNFKDEVVGTEVETPSNLETRMPASATNAEVDLESTATTKSKKTTKAGKKTKEAEAKVSSKVKTTKPSKAKKSAKEAKVVKNKTDRIIPKKTNKKSSEEEN